MEQQYLKYIFEMQVGDTIEIANCVVFDKRAEELILCNSLIWKTGYEWLKHFICLIR